MSLKERGRANWSFLVFCLEENGIVVVAVGMWKSPRFPRAVGKEGNRCLGFLFLQGPSGQVEKRFSVAGLARPPLRPGYICEAFGAAAIALVSPSVMPPGRELPGCAMQFDRASSLIQLYNFDSQTWASAGIAPTMNLVSPLCNLRGVTYTPTALGATMAIDLEFAASFGGNQVTLAAAVNTYGMYLRNANLGTWSVPQVAGFNFTGPIGSVAATVGVETTVNLQVTSFGGFQTPLSLQVQGLPWVCDTEVGR